MSEEEPELSEAGQPIFRHKPRETEFEFAIGDDQAIQAIVEHVQKHLGKVEMVFHEIVSDLVHIDVHWIKPTPQRDFHTLFTTGMSDRPMNVPDGVDDARHVELMIGLPSSWPIFEEALKDEANYWPIRLLKGLSRLPHEYDTWLAPGHTVPNNDPPEPYATGTKFCCALLFNPVTTPTGFDKLEVSPEKVVNFLGVIALFPEEVDLKLKKGSEELLKRLAKQGVSELLDPARKSVARRSLWPF